MLVEVPDTFIVQETLFILREHYDRAISHYKAHASEKAMWIARAQGFAYLKYTEAMESSETLYDFLALRH